MAMALKKKNLGLPGVLTDDPEPWMAPDESPAPAPAPAPAPPPTNGDTGQAPTAPGAGGATPEELKLRRQQIAAREAAELEQAANGFRYETPDSRPLSLPGSQASSYARLGGMAGMRPYRTPNFAMQASGPALDIFEGPAGALKPMADEMGRAFIRRRRGGF
jgi:hypothetical protein